MRIKLFLLLTLFVALPALAQRTGVQGVVVDAESGMPVSGATVILNNQNIMVTTGPQGDFLISNATAGTDDMSIFCYGFKDWTQSVNIVANVVEDLGKIKIKPETSAMKTYTGDNLLVNESQQPMYFCGIAKLLALLLFQKQTPIYSTQLAHFFQNFILKMALQ